MEPPRISTSGENCRNVLGGVKSPPPGRNRVKIKVGRSSAGWLGSRTKSVTSPGKVTTTDGSPKLRQGTKTNPQVVVTVGNKECNKKSVERKKKTSFKCMEQLKSTVPKTESRGSINMVGTPKCVQRSIFRFFPSRPRVSRVSLDNLDEEEEQVNATAE